MRLRAHRSYTGVGLTAAALIAASGYGQAVQCPSSPIALTSANSSPSDPYGPNLSGAWFTNLTSPALSISTSGLVIFRADTNLVAASGTTGAGGIWKWNGANSNLAEDTDTPPNGGSYSISPFNFPEINASGAFSFRDNSGSSAGLYNNPTGGAGNLGTLMKAGTANAAPGTGTTLASWSSPGSQLYLNATGSSAFYSGLTLGSGSPAVTSTNAAGIWAGTPGSLSLLVRQNDQTYTGSTAITNVNMGTIDSTQFDYNDNGKITFTGALQGTGVVTGTASPTNITSNQGLMTTRNGSLEIIARKGSAFPDASGNPYTGAATDGTQYNSVAASGAHDMNNAGQVVFSSTLRTATTTTPTTNGTAALFSDNTGTLKTVARHTQPLPASTGLSSLSWGSIFGTPVINGAGTIAFSNSSLTGIDPNTGVTITSAANSGLFKVDNTGLMSKVFRSGDPAPAYSAASGNPALNQNTGTVLFSGTPSGLAMNALGQMAFVDALQGTGTVNGSIGNASALFVVDASGNICVVAQKNMLFHVGPGDDRIVSSFGLGSINTSGNQDGRESSLDDNGNLVFNLQFTNAVSSSETVTSSGVFIVHIPAPTSASLLGLVGLIANRRRRR